MIRNSESRNSIVDSLIRNSESRNTFFESVIRIKESRNNFFDSLVRISESRNTFFISCFESWIKNQLILCFFANLWFPSSIERILTWFRNLKKLATLWAKISTSQFEAYHNRWEAVRAIKLELMSKILVRQWKTMQPMSFSFAKMSTISISYFDSDFRCYCTQKLRIESLSQIARWL